MDKKTKIENLHRQGLTPKEITKELGMDSGYTMRVLSDIENQKKRGDTDIGQAKEDKRVEMEKMQKRLRDLIPYENEQARIEFKKLEKELTTLRLEYCYLERVK